MKTIKKITALLLAFLVATLSISVVNAAPNTINSESGVTSVASFYVNNQREYRGTSNLSCLVNGTVGIKLIPENGRTSGARIKVEVRKCNSTNYIQSGKYYILMDGKRILGPFSYNFGGLVLTSYIAPDAYGNHIYQVELYSADRPTEPKMTGKTAMQTWGRCWCTDYIRQRFDLVGFMPDGGKFGPYLISNGFHKLTSNVTPRAGDIAVIQAGFPGVTNPAGHVAYIIKFDATTWKFSTVQGGSAASGWFDNSYCYNAYNIGWGTSAKNNSHIQFYRK